MRWAEKRRAKRAYATEKITFNSESNFYTGFTENISSGGVFISTRNLLPIGTELTLKLKLSDGQPPIDAVGIVRWVRDTEPGSDAAPGIGLQFSNLSDEDRDRINTFIDNREPIFYMD